MSRFHVITLCMIIFCTGNCMAESMQDTCDTGIQDTIIVGEVHVPGPLWPDSIGVPIYIWADEPIAAISWGLRPLDNRIRVSSFSKASSVFPSQMFIPTLVDTANNQVGFGWVDFTGLNPASSPKGLVGTLWIRPMTNVSIGETLEIDSCSLSSVYRCGIIVSTGAGETCRLTQSNFENSDGENLSFGNPQSDSDLLFSLDEGAGNLIHDWSGHGENGANVGFCQFSDGVSLSCLVFDGIDDMVTFPEITRYSQQLTVSLWLSVTDSASTVQYVVDHGSSGEWHIYRSGNMIYFGVHLGNCTYQCEWVDYPVATPVDGNWHHYAFVWSRWGSLSAFFDGDLLGGIPVSNGFLNGSAGGTPTIGNSKYNSNEFLKARVDEIRICRRALTAAEILNEYLRVGFVACGDADGSRQVDITDAVFLINYIFGGGAPPPKPVSADVTCNGRIDITDAVYLINYFFANGAVPCAACQ